MPIRLNIVRVLTCWPPVATRSHAPFAVISHREAKALKDASQDFSRATLEDVALWKKTNKSLMEIGYIPPS
jgi:hypothetical protein